LKASVVGRGGCSAEDVAMLEFRHDAPAEAIADALVDARPDLIGLSCYVWNIRTLLAVARLIRERRPGIHIVLGGPEVGPLAADVLREHPYVDVVVHSEGEVPFADIVEARRNGRGLEGVPGISFRDGESIVDAGPAPLVGDLDAYPSPHLARYVDYNRRAVCIETQRGCVFHCNFCFYNKDYSLRNRRFSIDRVKQELLLALEQDVMEIYLMDPVFNLNAARAKEICRFIAEHNHRRIPIHSEIWAEFLDDETASLMQQAGFRFLEVGLQTTDPTALATTERRLRLDRFNEGIAHLHRHGLHFQLQLIYGLPAETRATFAESLDFAMSLDPPELAVFLLLVLPGTELWRKAGELKLDFEREPPYPVRSHLSMSPEDIEYGRRLVLAAGFLQRSRSIRYLAREPQLTFSTIVDEWLASRPDGQEDAGDRETVLVFIKSTCDRRGIPPQFYLEFAALEFAEADALIRSATRTTSTMAPTP
jgi:anaerobic magnesium-protoporphyrin IX monomethyl ester cyclase